MREWSITITGKGYEGQRCRWVVCVCASEFTLCERVPSVSTSAHERAHHEERILSFAKPY